jgi:hypothetical protein
MHRVVSPTNLSGVILVRVHPGIESLPGHFSLISITVFFPSDHTRAFLETSVWTVFTISVAGTVQYPFQTIEPYDSGFSGLACGLVRFSQLFGNTKEGEIPDGHKGEGTTWRYYCGKE